MQKAQEPSTNKPLNSVWVGKDNSLIDAMFDFYAPNPTRIIDVGCDKRRMWKGSITGQHVAYYDRDASMNPDVVVEWHNMPDADKSVDVLVYDPPHLPDAAASKKSLSQYRTNYGLGAGVKSDNIENLHSPFYMRRKECCGVMGLFLPRLKITYTTISINGILNYLTKPCVNQE